MNKQEAVKEWQERFSNVTCAYSIIRSVSKSGMSRTIDFYVCVNNSLNRVTHLIADVTGYKQDSKTGFLKVRGTGMNMAWAVINGFNREAGTDLRVEIL